MAAKKGGGIVEPVGGGALGDADLGEEIQKKNVETFGG